MKKLIILLVITMSFSSCKDFKEGFKDAYNDATKKEGVDAKLETSEADNQNDGMITLKGDFIYDESQNAAVIQTKNQIYGVVIDENLKALNKEVKNYKKQVTDMVPVTVKARRIAKPEDEEGWPFRLEIQEIIKVEAPDPNTNEIIKLEN